jgi:hypothetical protein
VNATVLSATTIEFNIVGTKYVLELVPGTTQYQIDLTTPSVGTADLWKFSTGFNFLLSINTANAGAITLGAVELTNQEWVEEPDVIDFNVGLTAFNNMNATATVGANGIDVSYTKTKATSLMYYLINAAVKNGKIASDYKYINLRISSADTTEFLIELSGYPNMMHYVTLKDGSLDVTLVLDQLMLASQINALQYINITPMPNSLTATGQFRVSIAEFSNVALVNYEAQTTIGIGDWRQIGSVFTIDTGSKTIEWSAGTGYKNLMTRLNGSYATTGGLSYRYLNVNATVLSATTIEFNIVGTKYVLELVPGTTQYQIDLTTPSVGTADLWKFSTGFNFLLSINTANAGAITLDSIQFGN